MRRARLAQILRILPSVLPPWLARGERGAGAGASTRTGPRIAVIGNCQARGIVQAMGLLAPQARVDLVPMSRLGRDPRTLDAFAARLRGYDHVFSQPFAPGFFPDGGSDALAALLPGMRLFPAIVFSAFHPDAIYVGDLASMAATRLTPSPLHTYQSAIALFGHLRGLPAERIVPLYRAEVFERLGYLAGWDPAAEDLLAASRAVGLDLSGELLRWIRGGAFMHTINHPRLAVLGDVAARLLTEAGLTPAPDAVESYLADELLDGVIWPIYPAIAEVYGLPGSTTFKRRGRPGAPPRLLDLPEFVAESVALYRRLPAGRLRSARIDAWAATPEIGALFDRG